MWQNSSLAGTAPVREKVLDFERASGLRSPNNAESNYPVGAAP